MLVEILSSILIAYSIGTTTTFLIGAADVTPYEVTLVGFNFVFSTFEIILIAILVLVISILLNSWLQLELNKSSAKIGALFADAALISWLEDLPRSLSRDKISESELTKKITSDSYRLTIAVIQPLLVALPKVSLLFFSLVALIFIYPKSILFLVAMSLLVSVPIIALRRLIRSNGKKTTSLDKARFAEIKAAVDFADEIAIYNLQTEFYPRARKALDGWAIVYGRGVGLSSLPRYVAEFALFAGILMFCIWVQFSAPSISQLNVESISLAMVILFKSIPSMQLVLTSYGRVNGSKHLFYELFQRYFNNKTYSASNSSTASSSEKPIVPVSLPAKITKLSCTKVIVEFPDSDLYFPDFAAKSGRLLVIKGGSGSGKSTLIKSISGLIKHKGEILLDGKPLLHGKDVGYCSQNPPVFEGTILENLLISESADVIESVLDSESQEALKRFIALPLDYRLDEGGTNISGGQRIRIGICRALFSTRPLTILDEPTNGQDQEKVHQLISLIEVIKKTSIVIIASHDRRIFDQADDIIEINKDII